MISLNRGIAYVAAGGSGVLVFNFRSIDVNEIKPTVTLQVSPPKVTDPEDRWEEGKSITLHVAASDDVRVGRGVPRDEEVVATDGNYPYEHVIRAPLAQDLDSGQTFTVQARAYDTGDNETLTAPFILKLTDDATSSGSGMDELPKRGSTLRPQDPNRQVQRTDGSRCQ